ncbi:hypothetical protein A2U01_0007772 [Trifolium medium]|uniref:Uncharacterized protein n=1 Tax=Trifolium medium TaxID=97028 RepID=A0A392MHW8_9FABA|nr:hypothetical protein [Trifolium medium]
MSGFRPPHHPRPDLKGWWSFGASPGFRFGSTGNTTVAVVVVESLGFGSSPFWSHSGVAGGWVGWVCEVSSPLAHSSSGLGFSFQISLVLFGSYQHLWLAVFCRGQSPFLCSLCHRQSGYGAGFVTVDVWVFWAVFIRELMVGYVLRRSCAIYSVDCCAVLLISFGNDGVAYAVFFLNDGGLGSLWIHIAVVVVARILVHRWLWLWHYLVGFASVSSLTLSQLSFVSIRQFVVV